ncbi:MAG TPA: hypothetical protein VHT73_10900 [Thermodesulfobacteriota bacterium]|nr:hypothetical protein [Thermodesulfobacteriota bacterium]
MWTIGKSYKDNKEKEELNKRNEKLSAEIQASQSRAEHQISTILRLLGLDPEKLLERYPLGYVIFDINYKNEVFPYEKQLLDKYELNWDVVELTRPTKETFKLRLPDFQKKNGSGTTDIYITGPLKGTLEEEKPFDNGIAIGKVMMLSRILEVRNDGIIFIIGFTECQPLSWAYE